MTKLLASTAALALVLGLSGAAFAGPPDCNTDIPGKQTPGSFISAAAKAAGGRGKLQSHKDAVAGVAGTTLATGVPGVGDIDTDDQAGAGGDIQALLGRACGVGSRGGEQGS